MQLSNNGKIVVIDNEFEEVKSLLDVLNMNQMPYLYFDGKVETLPKSPYKGIRFVFLDIELDGMKGHDPDGKNKASAIVSILEKIIAKDNGPYAIIFWTKHRDVIEKTLENCQEKQIKPVITLDLNKSECKEGNVYSLKVISDKLKTKAAEFGPYSLYIMWENIATNSVSEFINSFANIFEFDKNWSENTKYLFYRLYKSYVEKNEVDDNKDKILCVMQLINRSFNDLLENNTVNSKKSLDLFEIPSLGGNEKKDDFNEKIDGIITEEIISKINSSLFIIGNPNFLKLSGVVFSDDDNELKKILFEKCFKKKTEEMSASALFCKLVITPQCDIAQDKNIFHRVIYGIIFNDEEGVEVQSGSSFLSFGPFYFNKKASSIVFHFQSITACNIDQLCSEDMLFGLRKDLFFDIQAKSANHVNRPGNCVIKKKLK